MARLRWIAIACLALLAAAQVAAIPAAVVAFDGATVAAAARRQVGVTLSYDPAYTRIAYPGGDVPLERGVCTDVVVRAFRAAGVDLQARVHEDMRANFRAYPRQWGLARPDPNIDHRRVPNLRTFFTREGRSLPVSADGADYRAGDVVSWKLPNGLDHIGVVSERIEVVSERANGSKVSRPWVVHNIGQGAREEDVLFAWTQTGHYRWFPGDPATAR